MNHFEARRPLLAIRLVDRLRAAGGEMVRTKLKDAVGADMSAAQFDELVRPLVDRGELVREEVRRKCTCYDGRSFERAATLYRLPPPAAAKPPKPKPKPRRKP